MAFRYRFSIITGGPGTGKTTVEKVILYIHQKIDDGTVLLMAPTGKQAGVWQRAPAIRKRLPCTVRWEL